MNNGERLNFIIFSTLVIILLVVGKYQSSFQFGIEAFPIRPSQLALVLFYGLFILQKKDVHLPLLPNYIFILMSGLLALLLGLWQGLGLWQESSLRFTLTSFALYLYPLYFWVGLNIFKDKKAIFNTFRIFFFSSFIGMVIFLVYESYIRNWAIPFGVHLSSDLLPMIAATNLIVFCGFYRDVFARPIYIAFALFFAAFLYFTQVRGVFLALFLSSIFGFVTLFLFKKNELYRRIINLIIVSFTLGSITIVLLAYALYGDLYFYIESLTTRIADLSISFRLLTWNDMLIHISSHPIFGHGIKAYYASGIYNNIKPEILGELLAPPSKSFLYFVNPHNSYLYLMYFSGFLGLFFFFYFIYSGFRQVNKQMVGLNDIEKKQIISLLSAFVFFLIMALVTAIFEIHYIAPFAWIYLAMAYSYTHICSTRNKNYENVE